MSSGRQPAERIAEALAARGAGYAFGVPGGGPNLDLVGALGAEGIQFVLGHGETATCVMASTYGHLAGTLSATVVTRGPGAASAVNGAAQATLDRHPLLLVTDTVPQTDADRVAHQRLDQGGMLGPVTKASIRVGADVDRAHLDAAFDRAVDEPAGCVHLDYDASATTTHVAAGEIHGTVAPPIGPDEIRRRISRARRPLVIVGRGATTHGAPPIAETLDAFGAPVLTTYQAAGALPSEHPLCGGLFTNAAAERPLLEQADLVITVGLDPVEPVPALWTHTAPVVSIAPTPTLDRYLPMVAEIVGPVAEILADTLTGDHDWDPVAGASHREHVRAALREQGAPLGPVEVVEAVATVRPDRVTTTVDAGAHFLAVMPFWAATEPNTLLISNGLATMGYAIPAAIGAALARPDEPVLAFVGDGGLSMTLAELETIARLELPVTVVVFNDSALSLIEIKQGEAHGGRDAVCYLPTDFAAAARAMQMDATTATTPEELTSALTGDWTRPRLVDARIDPGPYRHLIAVTRG